MLSNDNWVSKNIMVCMMNLVAVFLLFVEGVMATVEVLATNQVVEILFQVQNVVLMVDLRFVSAIIVVLFITLRIIVGRNMVVDLMLIRLLMSTLWSWTTYLYIDTLCFSSGLHLSSCSTTSKIVRYPALNNNYNRLCNPAFIVANPCLIILGGGAHEVRKCNKCGSFGHTNNFCCKKHGHRSYANQPLMSTF